MTNKTKKKQADLSYFDITNEISVKQRVGERNRECKKLLKRSQIQGSKVLSLSLSLSVCACHQHGFAIVFIKLYYWFTNCIDKNSNAHCNTCRRRRHTWRFVFICHNHNEYGTSSNELQQKTELNRLSSQIDEDKQNQLCREQCAFLYLLKIWHMFDI